VIVRQQIWVRLGGIELVPGRARYSLAEDDRLGTRLNVPIVYPNCTGQTAPHIDIVETERWRPPRR